MREILAETSARLGEIAGRFGGFGPLAAANLAFPGIGGVDIFEEGVGRAAGGADGRLVLDLLGFGLLDDIRRDGAGEY